MKCLTKILISSVLTITSVSAVADEDTKKTHFFYTINAGVAKVSVDNSVDKNADNKSNEDDQTALMLSSKVGFKFENDFSLYLGSDGVYYKRDGDIIATGLVGPGVDYTFPFADKKLSVGVVAGLGMDVNYSTLFDDFSDSFEFGSGFRGAISYQLNKKWNLELSAAKYNFDENDSETVALSVGYDLGQLFLSQVAGN